jgi:hypothetical protein
MEPINDFSWMQQLVVGKVRERFNFKKFSALSLEMPPVDKLRSPFHYRILFFPEKSKKPVLSLNLESSILGSYCFTEHAGASHINVRHSDDDVTYEQFKEWALDEADKVLN